MRNAHLDAPDTPKATLDLAVRRARKRLVPFLLLMYVISFLDRANIGFAKQALEKYAGISASSYALAAGLFFLTYSALELPSNLLLHKIGARFWMARIMVTWGLVSMATVFVHGSSSLYAVRLLLGAAEAGFFPGVILYLTYWFPGEVRARIFGLFYLGAPIAFIVGGPISGFLLQLESHGRLHGWQWMFLVEGALAVVVGAWSYWFLDNRPADARWLAPAERNSLTEAVAKETQGTPDHSMSIRWIFRDLHLLHLVLIYFFIQLSVYGVVFYLPSEVSALLKDPGAIETGLVSAIPWICALAGTFWLPRLADATGRHRMLAVLALLISGCASFLFPMAGPRLGLVALSIAATGLIAVQPLFWTFPTRYLSGRAAAGGLAMINALAAIGGFVAPNVKNWTDQAIGSHAGTFVLAGSAILNAGLIAGLARTPRLASKAMLKGR
jgi:MFS family permease